MTVIERPRWARRDVAMKLTGVPEDCLLRLANEGFVRARKLGEARKSACLFCVPDIEEWLENEAPKAPQFAVK